MSKTNVTPADPADKPQKRRKRRSKAQIIAQERYGQGTIEWVGRADRGRWFARISRPGQPRIRRPLETEDGRPLDRKEEDRAEAIRLTAEVSRLLREKAAAEDRARVGARLTVKQFGELWTSGELYERHGEVKGLKEKLASADTNAYRLAAYVYPVIGPMLVSDVTEQDVERTMRDAAKKAATKRGKPWRPASRLQLFRLLHRLFSLAIRPGRLRADNPVSDDFRPSVPKDDKLYSFLYPEELLALLKCKDIPIGRRVMYALACYTGLRKGSLYALKWSGVDLVHGTLTSLHSKTGLPQMFDIGYSGLPALLGDWFEYCGRPDGDEPVVRGVDVEEKCEARTLRDDLRAAGINREILFSEEPNVQALRFHDHRATFVTWAKRAGKGDGWITDRTGHVTPDMMKRYDRQARTLADLRYESFPDLANAVPDLSNDLSNVARMSDYRKGAVS